MKNTIIVCKSEDEMKKVLKALDETDVRWASGHMPSHFCYWKEYGDKLCITFNSITTHIVNKKLEYKYVTGEDFLGSGKSQPIVIYFKGNETIALDKETGKKGVARCHPSDEFDRITGATIAMDRLFAEDRKESSVDIEKHDDEKVSEPKFKVGDKVKIKKGLELHKEYRGYTYLDSMDEQKDAVLTVIAVAKEYYGTYSYKCSGKPSLWYPDEMIDLYEEPVKKTFKVGDKVKIKKGLELHKEYCGYMYLESMDEQKDAVLTVIEVEKECYGTYSYKCSGKPSFWCSDEMIDLYEEKTFKVGDRVRVREWDDMAEEFDHTAARINCKFGFVDDMRQYCGKIATIKEIRYGDLIKLVFDDESSCSLYNFSADMIEHVQEKNGDPKFKVGDRVQIKDWDEMKAEFGMCSNKSIDCKYGFTVDMIPLCGRKATITEIYKDRIELDFDDKSDDIHWFYSADMIKPLEEKFAEPHEFKVGDKVKIVNNNCSYTTYDDWFVENNINVRYAIEYSRGELPSDGEVGEIVAIAPHRIENSIIALVRINKSWYRNCCYMISPDGIEKI